MSTVTTPPPAPREPLAPATSALVTAFARACRVAARALALYPPEHPSASGALSHLMAAAHDASASGELRLAVLPDTLAVEGQSPARPDTALVEFAALLHAHQVARLAIHPDTGAEEWRRFLALVALPPEQARLRGGLTALWASEGQRTIGVEQIDYASLLREGIQGERVTWNAILEECLGGHAELADDWMLDVVLKILNDPSQAGTLVTAVEERTSAEGGRGPVVIAGLLQAVARFAEHTRIGDVEPLLVAIADAATHLPLPTLAPMVSQGAPGQRPELRQFIAGLKRRMSDAALAQRVADEVRGGQGSSPLLAETLTGVAPEVHRRASILALARQVLEQAPGLAAATDSVQSQVEQLLAGHDDKAFVSDSYATELERAGDRAVDLDRDATDPPGRIAAWTGSVSEDRIRQMDAQLLMDMMQVTRDVLTWRGVADLAVARINVFVVVGDFEAAAFLMESLRLQHEDHPVPEIREVALRVLGEVLNPGVMRHVASHLDTTDTSAVRAATRFCQAIGTSVIPPLAEALSREERARPRQHLMGILSSFGSAGHQAVERLKHSPNAAVRRTAVLLLREFGGQDALPELESLLNDREPHVQREATRAIALLGVDAAFDTLTRALSHGTENARSAITSVLWTLPAEETTALLAYIVARAPLGRHMLPIHERALQRLSAAGGSEAVQAIGAMLRRGSPFTPFRTGAMRRIAALALAQMGSPEAMAELETAAATGSWGVRSAARAAIARAGRPGGPASRGTD